MGYQLVAVVEGTAQAYRVQRVWYHPGLVRELDYGFCVRSDDFRDGNPEGGGVDMAVLQLAAEGPDLPGGVELANEEELRDLEGKAIGFVAYPLRAGTQWPSKSRPANCAYCCCLVGAMDHVIAVRDLGIPAEKRKYLFYDYEFEAGASGCPIFLANGHVVGMATNGYESIEADGKLNDYGPRIDCLRELLSYHNLGRVKGAGSKPAAPRGDWGPDPHLGDYRRAVRLVVEAWALKTIGKVRRVSGEVRPGTAPGARLLRRTFVSRYGRII